MKRLIGIIFSLILFSQSSQAMYLSYSDYMDEMADLINQIQLGRKSSYKIGETNVSDSCVVFLTKEMFLGENGKDIYETIIKNQSSFFEIMNGGTLKKYCPKYTKMESNQKAMAWVVVLTMMAHFESSCSIKAQAKGPNGKAVGYYQLHLGKEQNYDSDMNLCVKNASSNGKLSNKCALAMIEKQLEREKGELFSPKSYWDVLRPAGKAQKADDIQRALMKSKLCNPLAT
jgi:hypothetical protein